MVAMAASKASACSGRESPKAKREGVAERYRDREARSSQTLRHPAHVSAVPIFLGFASCHRCSLSPLSIFLSPKTCFYQKKVLGNWRISLAHFALLVTFLFFAVEFPRSCYCFKRFFFLWRALIFHIVGKSRSCAIFSAAWIIIAGFSYLVRLKLLYYDLYKCYFQSQSQHCSGCGVFNSISPWLMLVWCVCLVTGGVHTSHGRSNQHTSVVGKGRTNLVGVNLSSHNLRQAWSLHLLGSIRGPIGPVSSRCNVLLCRSVLVSGGGTEVPVLKSAAIFVSRSYISLRGSPVVLKLIPAVGIIAFAAWGLGPLVRLGRVMFFDRTDSSWKKSSSHYVMTSYIQPLLLWIGATLICRALDPVVLPTEASQAVKQRLLNFVRSLSTVLAFAYCLSSLIQQVQKFFMETHDSSGARNMGFDFAGKAVYTAVWAAAVSLFMELLGFSTQKWLTAGGLSTVLLTLAGREIFTNFLSSVMIHATRPFVVNEWIQTKIEGYEVSGTVEHVGWWSPTIIRGDDREAVHIPNHKFTVNVVRNLSQKTHWRIKTHLAISHLDVNKINNIVADMRKVLAKNPQVEQQKLHRRVFLEDVDPENQALRILVSCFVKTPHFEEYLCVKEAILLDLLRVVGHHRARLATPIRRVQKIYSEADLENVPFADSIFSRSRGTTNRPYLLVEPSYKINGDDRTKTSSRSAQTTEDKDTQIEAGLASDSKADAKAGSSSSIDSTNADQVKVTSEANSSIESKNSEVLTSDTQMRKLSSDGSSPQHKITGYPGKDTSVGNFKDGSLPGETPKNPRSSCSESDDGKTDMLLTNLQAKQYGDRPNVPTSIATPPLEENLVLGVALDSSKRTLPIEEDVTVAPPAETKALAAYNSGGSSISKDTKDGSFPSAAP